MMAVKRGKITSITKLISSVVRMDHSLIVPKEISKSLSGGSKEKMIK